MDRKEAAGKPTAKQSDHSTEYYGGLLGTSADD